jgi:hypothetical protein
MPAVTRKKTRRGGANGEEEDVERMPNNIQLNCRSNYKTGQGQDISWKNYLTLANTSRAHAGMEDFSIKEITNEGIRYLILGAYSSDLRTAVDKGDGNNKMNDRFNSIIQEIIADIKEPLFSNTSYELVIKMHTAIENFFNELQSMGNDLRGLLYKRRTNRNSKLSQQFAEQLKQNEEQQRLIGEQATQKFNNEIDMPDGWPVKLDLYFFYKQDPRYREISKYLLRVYQMTDYLKYNQNLDYSLTNAMREQANQNLFDEMLQDKCLESYEFTNYIPNGLKINAIKKKCREKYLVDHIVKPAYTKDTEIFKKYLNDAINKIYNKLLFL